MDQSFHLGRSRSGPPLVQSVIPLNRDLHCDINISNISKTMYGIHPTSPYFLRFEISEVQTTASYLLVPLHFMCYIRQLSLKPFHTIIITL